MKDNETDSIHTSTSTTTNDGQPIGTGAGVLSGAATGAAMGAAGGPVGAVVGGAVGAVTGGLLGKGIEKAAQNATDPAVHDAYWQENHARQPYASQGSYESHRTAYQTGYEGVKNHGIETDFAELEPKLATDYASRRTSGSVELEHARPAIRAGYERAAEDLRLVLHEEQLKVGKREVAAGQVEIRKVVHSENVQVPVELRREDVTIERVSASELGNVTAADAFTEKEISVTLHDEEAVVAKTAHTTGAVRVHKTAEVETHNVSETLRKEDVEVVRDGKTEVRHEETTAKH